MVKVYDGTNPLTDIMGDAHTVNDVTFSNNSTSKFVETFSKTEIEAGQVVVIQLIGDLAAETVQGNVDQHNALRGFEAVAVEIGEFAVTAPTLSLVQDTDDDGTLPLVDNDGEFTLRTTFEGVVAEGDELHIVATQVGTAYVAIDEVVLVEPADVTAGYKDFDLGDVISSDTIDLDVTVTLTRGETDEVVNRAFTIAAT